jgi:flagellar export protein FliJ
VARAEELRDAWVACRRRTEILERLRVRAQDEWRTEVRRAEIREIDDLVVARHRHRLLEGSR